MSPLVQTQMEGPELSVEVKLAISVRLSVYADLKLNLDIIQAQLDDERVAIQKEMEAAGVEKTWVDTIPLTIVRSSSNSLDKKEFVRLGGSLKLLDQATVKKAKKPYLKITLGNEREEG